MFKEQDQNTTRKPQKPTESSSQQYRGVRDEAVNEDQSQDSNEPYFENVERIMGEIPNQQKSQRQLLLQSQVMELQMRCNYLAITNQRLLEKLSDHVDKEKEGQPNKNLQSIQLTTSADQITQLQTQLQELEEWLVSFKEEFSNFQEKVNTEFSLYCQKIEDLQNRNQHLLHQRDHFERAFEQEKQSNYTLIRRNQELLMQLEEDRQKQVFSSPSGYRNMELQPDYQGELQVIIEKLAQELKHERNMRKKYYSDLKQVNIELQQSQKIIQKKNQIIYDLELRILDEQKQNLTEEGSRRTKPRNQVGRYL